MSDSIPLKTNKVPIEPRKKRKYVTYYKRIPKYRPILKVDNVTYYSLRKSAELANIAWPTAIDYSKNDKRCLRFRRKPKPDYPFYMYTYGIVRMFRKIYKEHIAKRHPPRKKGPKWKRKKEKWFGKNKIPNWSNTNVGRKHFTRKAIDLTKFEFK